jgi:cell division protein FtsQ
MARSAARLAQSSRQADRPGGLRLWLRRRRALLRPAALGVGALVLLGVAALALRAADPAGRASRFAEGFAETLGGLGFRVREVVIEGQRHTPRPLLLSALGVSRGDATFGFSPHEAKERLETLAWVQAAHVERRLPGTVLVRLEERQPFAVWQNQQRFVVIDREGKVVATDRVDQFGPLPLVVGPGAERAAAALHDRLLEQPEVMARTQAMVRIGERRWNLRLHSGADVLLPEGHEAVAIERLAELQRTQRLLDRPLAAIDMRLPDRLVLRRGAEPPAPAAPQPQARSGRG